MKRTVAYWLLFSAALCMPAYANYFHNPITHMNLNIGSAPNPTPADLRTIGDASYAFDARSDSGARNASRTELQAMTGKTASDMGGENLGVIVATDDLDKVVLLETPMGAHIVVSAQLLSGDGPKVVAATITPMRLTDIARAQKGEAVVFNDGHWGP
jgi:hypothetical protein